MRFARSFGELAAPVGGTVISGGEFDLNLFGRRRRRLRRRRGWRLCEASVVYRRIVGPAPCAPWHIPAGGNGGAAAAAAALLVGAEAQDVMSAAMRLEVRARDVDAARALAVEWDCVPSLGVDGTLGRVEATIVALPVRYEHSWGGGGMNIGGVRARHERRGGGGGGEADPRGAGVGTCEQRTRRDVLSLVVNAREVAAQLLALRPRVGKAHGLGDVDEGSTRWRWRDPLTRA